jgi:hypothetical protein
MNWSEVELKHKMSTIGSSNHTHSEPWGVEILRGEGGLSRFNRIGTFGTRLRKTATVLLKRAAPKLPTA